MHVCDLSATTVIERHQGQAASIIDGFRSLRAHPSCQAEMTWSYEAHSPVLDDKLVIEEYDYRSIDEVAADDAKVAICMLRGRVGPWSVCREVALTDEVIYQIRRKLNDLFSVRR